MMFNHFDGAHVDIYIFILYTFMANKYATAERIKLIKTIAFLVPIEICEFINLIKSKKETAFIFPVFRHNLYKIFLYYRI